jgi:hypothetical protein
MTTDERLNAFEDLLKNVREAVNHNVRVTQSKLKSQELKINFLETKIRILEASKDLGSKFEFPGGFK